MGRWQVDEAVMRLCRPRSMSASGYLQTFQRVSRSVRFDPDNGHQRNRARSLRTDIALSQLARCRAPV